MIVKTNTIIIESTKYLYDLLENIEYNLDVDAEFDVSYLLKGANVKFSNKYDSLAEHLIDYMNTSNSLDNDKLYIFVNLRSFINDKDIEMFYKTAIYNKLKILVLSGFDSKGVDYEKKTIIDSDLCQI